MKFKKLVPVAFASALALNACNAKFISTRVKGSVTPVSITWDVAFMGQFKTSSSDLEEALRNQDLPQHVKDELKRALGKAAVLKVKSWQDLIRGLRSKNKRILLDAIFEAGRFYFPKEMNEQKLLVVEVLKTYLKTSQDYQVRSHALHSLTKLGVPMLEEAHTLLNSEHSIERFVAAYHLMHLGDERSLPHLIRRLSVEEQPTVKRQIEKAIEAIKKRSAY